MNFNEWWNYVGSDHAMKVFAKAKLDPAYMRQAKTGLRVLGGASAIKLVDAARATPPGVAPDLEKVMRGTPRSKDAKPRKIPPSATFKAKMKRGAK